MLVGVAVLTLLVFTPNAEAAIEDGGTPSGGSGSYYTTNGFGWYSYDVNSGVGPESWSSGGPWSRVQSICRAEGANRVDAFIVQRPGGNDSGNNAKVYRYETAGYRPWWPGYKGDRGGNWLSLATAEAHFNSIDPVARQNFRFGVNVAWFCFNSINYTLTPTINGSPSTREGGSPVNLTPNVANAGPTQSSNVAWEINTFNLNATEAIPPGGISALTPTQFYGHSPRLVSSGTRTFAVGNTPVTISAQTLSDVSIGSRVCYTLSVRPYSSSAGTTARHSTPFCVTISKKPKVQILGSDLIVGKNTTSAISTATTRKTVDGTARTYGSWGEYGAIASGIITGFGSGGGYSGGNTNSAYCNASYLTFTNAGTSRCTAASSRKGGYALSKQLPDIAGRFVYKVPITGSSFNLADATSGIYGVDSRTSPVINVSGGTIAKGKSVIISAGTATINITSNIEYTGETLNRIADIPQVVIIANNINIDESVTRVDAWLIATGSAGNINTCSRIRNPATELNATRCKETLTVNGPVVARHLYLYRTAGSESGAGSGIPAEVFNLRPDAYLWATHTMTGTGRLQTVSTKELPPRF